MPAKAVILGAIAVAAAPAMVAVFWPKAADDDLARAVQISGPISGFTQSRDRIQVRLTPASSQAERDARNQVLVTDADGDKLAIPLKRGQTWASAELPTTLADATSLQISVE